MAGGGQFEGRVAAIRDAVVEVVDLVFDAGPPPVDDAVEIADADWRIVVAEIQAQLDARSARAIALEPTNGLRHGAAPRRSVRRRAPFCSSASRGSREIAAGARAPVPYRPGADHRAGRRRLGVIAFLGGCAALSTRRLALTPSKTQATLEILVSTLDNQIRGTCSAIRRRFGRSSARSSCSC
jgi:hypothetical protein